jgi:MoaA/NifB/PqqE/SkfB family radical SAM enzyme
MEQNQAGKSYQETNPSPLARLQRLRNRLDSWWHRRSSGLSDEAFLTALFRKHLGRSPDPLSEANATLALRQGLVNRRWLVDYVANSPESHHYRIVCHLWQDTLGREPSLVERNLGMQVLEESETGADALHYLLMTISDEQRSDIDPLLDPAACQAACDSHRIWLTLLDRKPTPEEQHLAFAALLKGDDLDTVHQLLTTMCDLGWEQRCAEGEDLAFVEYTFQDLLGRPADPPGRDNTLHALQQGLLTRPGLWAEIINSSEFQTYQPLRALYLELLERDPTLAERDAMRLLQEKKTDLASLRHAIVRTMEYTFHQIPPPPDEEPYRAPPPRQVTIELTTRCNIVPPCVMCGRILADPESRWCDWDLDLRIWQRLLPTLQQAEFIEMFGNGEPLVYPHFFDLLAELDSRRSTIGFNTNGHLLTEANCRQLIQHGVSWISISLDAATSQTYRHIRRRKDFPQLLDKIRRLVQLKAELDCQKPTVEINMTVMCHNLPEAPRFVELAAELGVNQVMFQQIQPGQNWSVDLEDGYRFDYQQEELQNCVSLHQQMMEQAWSRAQALGIPLKYDIVYRGTGVNWPAERSTGHAPSPEVPPAAQHTLVLPDQIPCLEPWAHLLVSVNGDAAFCCYQVEHLILGNVLEDPIEEIWNGPRARTVRSLFLQGQVPYCCHGCFRLSGRD